MANTIRLKRGSGSDPSASDLVVGELAIRTDSGKIFTKKDNGSVAEISGGGGISDGDKGDITVSNGGDTFTIDNGAVTTQKILNGTIVNEDISASASISGLKVAPSFGNQNIITTGTFASGNQTITSTAPSITFTDSNNNPDYQVKVDLGAFVIRDNTADANRLSISSSGDTTINRHCSVSNNLSVAGTTTSTGNISGPLLSLTGDSSESGTDDATILLNSAGGTNSDFARIRQVDSDNSFRIENKASGSYESILKGTSDRVIELHHQGSKKLETSSSGVTVTGTLVADGFTGPLTGNVTGNASGSSGSCTGNAATASALANARTIAGTSFDGSANIDISYTNLTNKLSVGDGGLTQNNFTNTLKSKLDGIAAQATNVTNNNQLTNGAGYLTSVNTSNITNNAVSLDKLVDIAQNRVIGRVASGTGDATTLTAANVRTMINVEDGATADQTAAEIKTLLQSNKLTSSEITSGTIGSGLLANDAVTFAKMQNISDGHFIARNAGGTGDPQQLNATEARALLNVEDGATADQSANEILTLLKTVDGSGSGLDADTLDGISVASLVRSDTADTITAPLVINGGTANATDDATLLVKATNNNDWGLKIDKYNNSATEFGARIEVGSSSTYALQVTGNGSEVFRIQGNGNVVLSGTVDGRDLAADGSKLDGIAAGATNVTNNNQLTNGAGYTSFDGNYNSLSNRPTIPTNNNQLTNGAGYITASQVSSAPAAAKKWVVFSQSTIADDYGITSITYHGTGQYTINFDGNMANTNYSVQGFAFRNGGGGRVLVHVDTYSTYTTSALRIMTSGAQNVGNVGLITVNPNKVNIAIFGDT